MREVYTYGIDCIYPIVVDYQGAVWECWIYLKDNFDQKCPQVGMIRGPWTPDRHASICSTTASQPPTISSFRVDIHLV